MIVPLSTGFDSYFSRDSRAWTGSRIDIAQFLRAARAMPGRHSAISKILFRCGESAAMVITKRL
jgi:hypothetical protein